MILYTVPANVEAVVKHIRFVNTDETNPHYVVYYVQGLQAGGIIEIPPGESYSDTDAWTLEEGDEIEAEDIHASGLVNFFVNKLERAL